MKKKARTLTALIAASMLLSACGTSPKEEKVEKITWYVPVLITGNGKENVFNKVNELLRQKYSLELDVVGIDSGNFNQKMQVMNAGNEEYDIAFTSHWMNNYFSNVSNGVFYELTEEVLKEYAPDTYKSMSDEIWSAVKVNGKIYGVPNWQIQTRASGVLIPKEFAQATDTDINSITNLDDVTAYLRKMNAVNPKCNKIGQLWTQLMPYYEMIEVYEEGMPGAVVFTNTGKPEIINQYESQSFIDYIHMRQEWVKEGLSVDKYLPDSKANTKEIKEEPFNVNVYKPGGAAEYSNRKGYEYQSTQISQAIIDTSGVTAAMTGVSATSNNPELALKMIEIVNTDSEIHNLLSYGLEGTDYEKTSETQIKKNSDALYSGIDNWMMGTVRNTYMLDTQEPTIWDDTKAFNESAIISPLLGFNPDISKFALEIANCKTVINEYLETLELGLESDARLEEFRLKLKEAGSESIISGLQQQVDEWYETYNN